MSDFIGGAILGAIVGCLLGWASADYIPSKVIEICEKELPRNQSCVLTAKPAQGGRDE